MSFVFNTNLLKGIGYVTSGWESVQRGGDVLLLLVVVVVVVGEFVKEGVMSLDSER
jgi:hypothetical protein